MLNIPTWSEITRAKKMMADLTGNIGLVEMDSNRWYKKIGKIVSWSHLEKNQIQKSILK